MSDKRKTVSFNRGNHKIVLPKYCECGGLLVYSFDFGYTFVYCKKCTPVQHVSIDFMTKPSQRSASTTKAE